MWQREVSSDRRTAADAGGVGGRGGRGEGGGVVRLIDWLDGQKCWRGGAGKRKSEEGRSRKQRVEEGKKDVGEAHRRSGVAHFHLGFPAGR